jgi:hypothetical protein
MHSVLDLDDVILNFHPAYIDFALLHLNIEMDMTRHNTYSFYKQYGISDEEFLDHVRSDQFMSLVKPFDYAKKSIEKLVENNSKVIVVTARGFMPNAKEYVQKVFELNELYADEIIVPPVGIPKSACYQKFNKIDLLIDDASHNADDAIKSKIVNNVYLVNKPWNSDYVVVSDIVKRVDNLEEAIDQYLNK